VQTVPRTSRSLFGAQQGNNCVFGGNSTTGRATLTTLSLVTVLSVVLAACPSHLPAARIIIAVPPSLDIGTTKNLTMENWKYSIASTKFLCCYYSLGGATWLPANPWFSSCCFPAVAAVLLLLLALLILVYVEDNSRLMLIIISARQHICYSALYAIARPSVRLSVCLSHWWISQRRLKFGSRNLNHGVAPWL